MVQIKNRKTGLYDKKGVHSHWTEKMHQRGAWGGLAQAKNHISLHFNYYNMNEYIIRDYLNSDFIILDDDYNVEIKPVSDYVIPKLQKFIEEYNHKDYAIDEVKLCKKLLKEFSD